MRYGCILLLLFTAFPALATPSFEAVRTAHTRSDGRLLDRHGELLHELRVNDAVRRLEWVPLAQVSPALQQAVIAAEDQRFYNHHGVDWLALTAATARAIWSDRPRGASTITMQLSAWLDPSLKGNGIRRSLEQKWRQVRAARDIEAEWDKRQVLEAYLNLVYFRGELQGIAAASRGLFDKNPDGLDQAESLLLASLLRAPGAGPERLAQRACVLGRALQWEVSCHQLQDLATTLATGNYRIRPAANDALHVAHKLLQHGQQQVTSSLDAGLQRFVASTLYHQLSQLRGVEVDDGAVLVVDNNSGEVLAYVGNGGNSYIDGIQARRQAGSTLKPLLYELAIERRHLTAASILDDTPVNVVTQGGLYVPQNYDHDFKGPVSLRMALGSSLNVPAVRTLMLLGEESLLSRLRALGYDQLREQGDYYGYSLALGAADVSLWQMVNAYRTLANQGRWSPLALQPGHGTRGTKVMQAQASYIIANILADRSARSLTFGLENVLATGYWSAVKTGTSKDMRDNWCIGFSDRFTVGVWIGNFDGRPMQDVSGITGAAPIWLDVMNYLHQQRRSRAPRPPGGVISRPIHYAPAIEPPRTELFLASTEMEEVILPQHNSERIPRFTYPGSGTILAIDPDIPPPNQRLFFEIESEAAAYTVRIDGGPQQGLDEGWQPLPGRHQAVLYDQNGVVLDTTAFEVRGAPLQPASL